MSADRQLLERFLRGELDAEAIDALERRLDEEPELQRELGALAQEAYEAELPDLGTTRMSLFQGRAFAAEPIAAGVELREVIGRGGMGVVHRGLQHSLGRTVAVKSVRDPERHRAPLLQEAVLTGYLEHPNIAPVHEITTGADGQPLVVLKHIEGTVWSDTLPRPNQPSAMPLEWHLRVVLQICQALRFAHSRGVVHRDVKPSNVMIGEFDEVYLMDWGLGVCLDAGSRLPSLADQRGIAGTPAFMAPEQLEEDPSGIGTHTDVYLVGACLYHLATGEPPQAGTKLAEIREAVKARRGLSLPAETPPELAGIIERAMALAPTDRYASIGDLRDALEGFLEHRTSETLVARGDERAEAMMEAHGASDAEAAERAFFDAAFNYRAALDSWPNNEGAQQKLDALVRARVEQLISLDAPLAARRALAIVEAADSELNARVEAAVAREHEARFRLEHYERGDNRVFGLMMRRVIGGALGLIWIAISVALVAVPVTSLTTLLVGSVGVLFVTTFVIIRARHVMLDVRLNRHNAMISLIAEVALVVMIALAAVTDRPVTDVLTESMLLVALAAGAVAAVMDTRVFLTALAYLAGYVACRLDPSLLRFAFPAAAVAMVAVSHGINVITARRAATSSG